jgi:hypothetical protein
VLLIGRETRQCDGLAFLLDQAWVALHTTPSAAQARKGAGAADERALRELYAWRRWAHAYAQQQPLHRRCVAMSSGCEHVGEGGGGVTMGSRPAAPQR